MLGFGKKKPVEHVCKNCSLYDRRAGACGVEVMMHGERYELPVLPNSPCFWEANDIPVSTIRIFKDGDRTCVQTTD